MGAADILKVSFEFSPKLGVRELPKLSPTKESNVPGLYIVGDLADAPIIKVALNQGYEVAERLAAELREKPAADGDLLDVVVIGAGPAGIGAALALSQAGLRYVVLEKERPFQTIQNFPKAKLIFSEPRSIESRGGFWVEDAAKEVLVERWREALEQKMLVVHQPEHVTDCRKQGDSFVVSAEVGEGGADASMARLPGAWSAEAGAKNTYRARRVILAIGRRGTVNKLGVEGEHLEKVRYSLKDPEEHRGRKVLVVGGGDSAVEAATSCAEAGADVTIAHRGDAFSRAKPQNQEKLARLAEAGRLKVELSTVPVAVDERTVTLKRGAERYQIDNDDVLVFIGTKLPTPFLKKLGVRMEGELSWQRATWVLSFALMTYLFYVLKAKRPFFPFGPGDPLEQVPLALKADWGWRSVDGGFWGTVVYTLLIAGFGIKAYRKYPSPVQKRRYVSLVFFQALFLFGLPEIIAPLVIEHGWHVYNFSVPWPLNIWSVVNAPSWEGSTQTAVLWMLLGAATSFVLVPLYVRKHGTRFCSYLCGCGGLAETVGDQWRHLAPRGLSSYKAEWAGKVVLVAAVPVTLLILNDAWQFFAAGALSDAKTFAQHWYGLVVDFWLASVVGVAFYPYLGNRVWCRFFCPLRAYMEILSKWFSRITIKANDKCIGCGECTRWCQMGIDVQKFAQRRTDMDNTNSSCIQCGICVQVCPMEVLSIGERGAPPLPSSKTAKGLPIVQ